MKKQTSYQKLKAENLKLRQQLYTLVMEPESLEALELKGLLSMKYEMNNAAMQGTYRPSVFFHREPNELDNLEVETLELDTKEWAESMARFKMEWDAKTKSPPFADKIIELAGKISIEDMMKLPPIEVRTDGYAMAVTDEPADEGKGKGVFQQIKDNNPTLSNTLSRKDLDAWISSVTCIKPEKERVVKSNNFESVFEFMTEGERDEYLGIVLCSIRCGEYYLMGENLHNKYWSFVQRMVEKYSEQALKKQGKWGWLNKTLQKIRDGWNKKS